MKIFLKLQGMAILILLSGAAIIYFATSIYTAPSGTWFASNGMLACAAIAVVYGIPLVIVGGTVAFLTTKHFDVLAWQKPAAIAIGLIAIVLVGMLYTMLNSVMEHQGSADMFEQHVLRAMGFSFSKIDPTQGTSDPALDVILVNAKHLPDKENVVTGTQSVPGHRR